MTMDKFLEENSHSGSSQGAPQDDKRGKKRKSEALHFLQGNCKSYEIPVKLGGQPIQAILDTVQHVLRLQGLVYRKNL